MRSRRGKERGRGGAARGADDRERHLAVDLLRRAFDVALALVASGVSSPFRFCALGLLLLLLPPWQRRPP
jgi:hypothetical protein